jgi:hypothetical protein
VHAVATGAWVLVEIAFFAIQRLRYHRLNRVNEKRPSAQDIDERFHNFLTLAPVLDIQDFISGWFLHIPISEIRVGNVADFIAYAYWCAPRGESLAVSFPICDGIGGVSRSHVAHSHTSAASCFLEFL